MTPRERMLETLLYGKPDKIPLTPGGGRESTRQRWHREGLPESVAPGDIAEYAYRQAGGTHEWPKGGTGFAFDYRMRPMFEEKVIERKANSQVVQDWKGNVCEIGNEFDVKYLRHAIDFVTRRWIKCPVETRRDWEDMVWRYDAADPTRFPDAPEQRAAAVKDRAHYLAWSGISGPFWQLREWLGFEGLCCMLIDDPAFVKDMITFWTEFVATLLEKALSFVVPDEVHFSEDMAYKSFSMISPAMTREFLLPAYRRWSAIIKGAGVPVLAMDSDGFVGELIPIWIEAGFNVCDPIEVAAGNDLVAYRREFGRRMGFRGGIDKRALAKGGRVMRDELLRLKPVIEGGGYLPSCDHGVPSDISWTNFVEYTGLLAKMTGWL